MACAGDRWVIDEYTMETGEKPAETFMRGLTGRQKTEAIALVGLLSERGNTLRPPKSGPLGGGLFELRGHQVRIFYVFRPGRRITLLDGMIKKQDEIPPAVMERMRKLQRTVEAEGPKGGRGP